MQITRLVDALRSHEVPGGAPVDADFDRVTELVAALYHFEFHRREEAAVHTWHRATADRDRDAAAELSDRLRTLLEDSNHRAMTMAEIDDAMTRESLIPLRLEVDFDDYREMLIYRRGTRHDEVELRTWAGLRRRRRPITLDERLVLHTQVQSREWFERQGRDPADRGLVPDQITLKHFRDVPRANITSLIPSVQVRFRRVDTLMLGVPAVASGLVVLLTKALSTIGLIFVLIGAWLGLRSEEPTLDQGALVALIGGLVALGSFLVRQWTKLKNRRVRYLKVLTESLYHHMIGDGPDVLHALMYAAERQEVAEVVIAYRFLLAAPEGRTAAELDDEIEAWLAGITDTDIDFDIDDAVTKLLALDMAHTGSRDGDGQRDRDARDRLVATSVPEVLTDLNRRWDALFSTDETDHVPVTKQRDDPGKGTPGPPKPTAAQRDRSTR